jgi:type IV secretion/conjugal transfer VirB4 family ATPase
MLNISEYKQHPDQLSDLLPWAYLIAEGVIANKDGSFQRTFLFRGSDVDSSTNESLVIACAQINNALKRLPGGWSIFVEAARKESSAYESSDFPDKASYLLDSERKMFFTEEGNHYESEYYITFVFLPPDEKYLKAGNKLVENSNTGKEISYDKYLEEFIEHTDRIGGMLSEVMPEFKALDDSETLSYLHYTISMKDFKIKVPETPMYLDAILADESLYGGLQPRIGNKHIRTASIVSFPGSTIPGILDDINRLPLTYRWVSRYIAMDKTEAEGELSKYRKKWFAKRKSMLTMIKETAFGGESINVDDNAVRNAMDASEALGEVSSDMVSYGYFTATITVWDEDPEIANEKLKQVERIINNRGFVARREDMNAVQAWLSSVPGHVYSNVRRPLISSMNLIHMMPMSAVWAGQKNNNHLKGAPLLYAVTNGNTPFRFVNHIGDVGHTMILGPTGAGKSVLLNLMEMQFLRYKDAQVYIFDKGASALVPTLSVGGDFYDLGAEQGGLSFQPLADIDDPKNMTWGYEWLQSLLIQENLTVTPTIKKDVWEALQLLAKSERQSRTITGFHSLVQNTKVQQAITPYTLNGAYGNLLDSDTDTISYGSFQCFEMEKLMNSKNAVMPVLFYLFHKLEQRFDGKPTLLVLDEAWLFLDNPIFAAKIRDWLKVLRKANVSVIFATQSISDAMKSNIAPSLIESCPVRIFLPNDRAQEEDQQKHYQTMGLNSQQISLLATAQKKREYYFQSSLGNRMFELGLSDIALAFCATADPKSRKMVMKIFKEHGKDGFLEEFMKVKKIEWALEWLESEKEALSNEKKA